MHLVAIVALLALTRAEIIQRMRAPIVTRADGFVKVYADCPEDMRQEFQRPVASFAAETVETLYGGFGMKPLRFKSPGVSVHIGSVRTNDTKVVARASTNGTAVATRIYIRSPAFADLARLRIELVKAFMRSVKGREVADGEAEDIFRKADPDWRKEHERELIERWLAGERVVDDEKAIALMRKIIEPGAASRRDVLIFASRLFLYPELFDEKFAGVHGCLSFRDAVDAAAKDPYVRLRALRKAGEVVLFGGGRGEAMSGASRKYSEFLTELARGEKGADELHRMLDEADAMLASALEEAR